MKSKDARKELKQSVQKNVGKIEKAKKEQSAILAQTIYLGTVGILFILPVIIGAYLGVWLDDKLKGFSISWTMSLIIVGVFIGALNVYFFIKK
jgi:ATP synthase protein I